MAATEKQKRFVHEYMIDMNATQAAIRAGYSKNNADKIGPGLLAKPNVQEYYNENRQKQIERTDITSDKILQELAQIAFLSKCVKTSDKLKALELLGKNLALFTDRSNVSIEGQVKVIDDVERN